MESDSCSTLDTFHPRKWPHGERLPGSTTEICDLQSVTVNGRVFQRGETVRWMRDDGTVVTGTLFIRAQRTTYTDGRREEFITVRIDGRTAWDGQIPSYVMTDTLEKVRQR